MVRVLSRSIVGVGLVALGAVGGAAVRAAPDRPAVPAAISAPRPPVEVRTVVRRRTVHVYRRPHHARLRAGSASAPRTLAPVPASPPSPAPAAVRAVAPPAARVVRPAVPAAPARPLVTRTSGAGGGGGGGEREHEDGHDGGREDGGHDD